MGLRPSRKSAVAGRPEKGATVAGGIPHGIWCQCPGCKMERRGRVEREARKAAKGRDPGVQE